MSTITNSTPAPANTSDARNGKMDPEILALAQQSDGQLRAKAAELLLDAETKLRALRMTARALEQAKVPLTSAIIDQNTAEVIDDLTQIRKQLSGMKARAANFAIDKQRREAASSSGK